MQIISNTNGSHLSFVQTIIENHDDLIIVSPYLATDMHEFLSKFNFQHAKNITLITTFKPRDLEQIIKPGILLSVFNYFKEQVKHAKLQLHIDNSLHGKIYIGQSKHQQCALVSSANFTNNGMLKNHEWGIATSNLQTIKDLESQILQEIEYEDVTYTQIEQANKHANVYLDNHPEWQNKPGVQSDILNQVYKTEDANNTQPKYFLKPIGDSLHPYRLEDQIDFSRLHENLHFSKKRPARVRKGDFLITTAVGPTSLVSYYKVTGSISYATHDEIKANPDLERWPWYVEGRNQSPSFGKNWWEHDLKRKNLLDAFRLKFPAIPVTSAGGFTLDTLNWHSDKVELTEEFGQFLIEAIKSKVPPSN